MRVELKSVSNARQLGGYPTADGRTVKYDLLFRTGRLDELSCEEAGVFQNVGDVIDFRMEMEIGKAKTPDGAVYHHVNIIDDSQLGKDGDKGSLLEMSAEKLWQFIDTAEKLGIFGETMYINFLENAVGQRGYREFFGILLQAKKGVLWHCTSGKDRTGLAAMLLLSALGADEETIMKDYLLTNVYNADRIRATKAYFFDKTQDETMAEKAILLMDGVSEKPMKNVLKHMKEQYGSVRGYITDVLGITDDDIQNLQEKFLTKDR